MELKSPRTSVSQTLDHSLLKSGDITANKDAEILQQPSVN